MIQKLLILVYIIAGLAVVYKDELNLTDYQLLTIVIVAILLKLIIENIIYKV